MHAATTVHDGQRGERCSTCVTPSSAAAIANASSPTRCARASTRRPIRARARSCSRSSNHLHAFARDVRLTEEEWAHGDRLPDPRRATSPTTSARSSSCSPTSSGSRCWPSAINHAATGRRDRVDGLRPVLRRGLARVPDRRRHRQGRQRASRAGSRAASPTRTASRSRAPASRSGRPTTRASTTSSTATTLARPRAPLLRRRRPVLVLVGQARGLPDPRTTGPWATCSRRAGSAARRVPRTSTSWSAAEGYKTLITHVFVDGDEYLDADAVFGVKESLIAPLRAPRRRATAPDGRDDRRAVVAHDLRLRRLAASMSETP